MEAKNVSRGVSSESPHGLGIIVTYLSKVIDPVVRYASVISFIAVAFMMFITFVNVLGRAMFDFPIKGYFETVEFSMALMTIFGIGYCALFKGHVRVDVVSSFVSKRANSVMDIFAYGIAFIFYALITWQGFLNGISNLQDGLTSGVLRIPIYPINFTLVVGAAFLTLIFFRDFLKAIYEVRK
jgi:TRAP-type C4-dicarboxylate transport system permease small subunit